MRLAANQNVTMLGADHDGQKSSGNAVDRIEISLHQRLPVLLINQSQWQGFADANIVHQHVNLRPLC